MYIYICCLPAKGCHPSVGIGFVQLCVCGACACRSGGCACARGQGLAQDTPRSKTKGLKVCAPCVNSAAHVDYKSWRAFRWKFSVGRDSRVVSLSLFLRRSSFASAEASGWLTILRVQCRWSHDQVYKHADICVQTFGRLVY